jgi:single-strand DNA-binding protein
MDGLQVAFTGRVGGDPERRFTSSGTEVLQFSVLPADSKVSESPEWVKCLVFVEKPHELAADRLAKGSEVYVEGRLRLGRWTAQDGSPRSGLNCNAWTVQPPRRPRACGAPARSSNRRNLDAISAGRAHR